MEAGRLVADVVPRDAVDGELLRRAPGRRFGWLGFGLGGCRWIDDRDLLVRLRLRIGPGVPAAAEARHAGADGECEHRSSRQLTDHGLLPRYASRPALCRARSSLHVTFTLQRDGGAMMA